MRGGAAGAMPQASPAGAFAFPFIQVAGDPSVAPGVTADIGTRAFLADGSAAWDKFGAADTSWSPVGSGAAGPVTSVNGQVGAVVAPYFVAGIATGASQLSTLASAGFTEGALVWVSSVGAKFKLVQSALATDGRSVVNASGKAGYQWLRQLENNQKWAAQVTWFIDPVSGSDESLGNTSATAIKTLAELAARWWDAQIAANATWTVLDNVPTSDTPFWNFQTLTPNAGTITLTITGVLGATTGSGGRAIDNTLYSGSVTGFVAAADGPNADDIQMTDAAVTGGSFTAAGLMASGVLFNTTSGTSKFFYALKDLGAQTARISAPQPNPSTGQTWSACTLAVAQTYKAYTLKTFPTQNWGVSNQGRQLHITGQFLYDNSTSLPDDTSPGWGIQRKLMWLGPKSRYQIILDSNCMHEVNVGQSLVPIGKVPTQMNGGAYRSVAGTAEITLFGIFGFGGPTVLQGCNLQTNDAAYLTIEAPIAIHDTTPSAGHGCLFATSSSRISFNNVVVGAGLSGKGNTGKLIVVNQLSEVGYTFNSAAPPVNAGSTSDGTPITIDSTSYTVAAIPAVNNTRLRSGANFP